MMFGASHPTWESDVATTMALANGSQLNTLRIMNFLEEGANDPTLSTAPYNSARWTIVDQYLASAAAAGDHTLLDFATFRNLAWNNCLGPSYDWGSFLSWVGNRVNTVNGRVYNQDPSLAMVALAAEENPPGSYTLTANNGEPCTIAYSTSELTAFFTRTLSEARQAFPKQISETGGFLHLDYDSGVNWQSIMGDPDDQVCSLHVYSSGDTTISVPNVASYCKSLGKPWIDEEFGFPQSNGDAARSVEFQNQYSLSAQYGAAGTLFWNLGPQDAGETYDVNQNTPVTWSTVIANKPS
jgi:hypothetical protein